jgi:UDP-glucose 4-epimerase
LTTYWVTGATGLIGRRVVDRLWRENKDVVAISRSARRAFAHLGERAVDLDLAAGDVAALPMHEGDIVLIALASRITTSADVGLLRQLMSVDSIGHLRLLDHLGDAATHVVYASSCTVYGWPARMPVSDDAPISPANVYALNKVACERFLALAPMSVSTLRIAQVYGPGASPEAALYAFLSRAAAGEPPIIRSDPETVRDYVHVDDVVNAICLAARSRFDGTLNIGSGSGVSLRNLAHLCLEVAGLDREPLVEGSPKGPRQNMWLDLARARQSIGYQPQISLRQGIENEYRRLFGATRTI